MKKELTPEQIYKRNQKRAKILTNITPFVFWGLLALSLICIIFALKNSFGNINEILHLLDDKVFNNTQIQANYAVLVEKYGEWVIGQQGGGFTISFINIGRALFSGLMMINVILAVVFFISAYLLGKWLLPKIAKQITQDNQDMVNLTVLKNSSKE